MPQAAIPDVNVALQTRLASLYQAEQHKDSTAATMSIMDINSLLPDDLQLNFVSRLSMEDVMAKHYKVQCPDCNDVIEINDKNRQRRWCGFSKESSVILGIKYETYFVMCEDCDLKIFYEDRKDITVYESAQNVYDIYDLPTPPVCETLLGSTFLVSKYWTWHKLVTRILYNRVKMFRDRYSVSGEDEGDLVQGAEKVE